MADNIPEDAKCENCTAKDDVIAQLQTANFQLNLSLETTDQEMRDLYTDGLSKRLAIRLEGNRAAAMLGQTSGQLEKITAERDRMLDQIKKFSPVEKS